MINAFTSSNKQIYNFFPKEESQRLYQARSSTPGSYRLTSLRTFSIVLLIDLSFRSGLLTFQFSHNSVRFAGFLYDLGLNLVVLYV